MTTHRILYMMLLGCAAGCRSTPGQAAPAPLPPLSVYEITPGADTPAVVVRRVERDPLAALGATRRITLSANDADVRTLLLWLAEEAGVSLIVAPDVRARITVHFEDVPAAAALRAIISEARLSVLTSALEPKWPPVVFFQIPVNINDASVERIVERFGVSAELAKWVVESRPTP